MIDENTKKQINDIFSSITPPNKLLDPSAIRINEDDIRKNIDTLLSTLKLGNQLAEIEKVKNIDEIFSLLGKIDKVKSSNFYKEHSKINLFAYQNNLPEILEPLNKFAKIDHYINTKKSRMADYFLDPRIPRLGGKFDMGMDEQFGWPMHPMEEAIFMLMEKHTSELKAQKENFPQNEKINSIYAAALYFDNPNFLSKAPKQVEWLEVYADNNLEILEKKYETSFGLQNKRLTANELFEFSTKNNPKLLDYLINNQEKITKENDRFYSKMLRKSLNMIEKDDLILVRAILKNIKNDIQLQQDWNDMGSQSIIDSPKHPNVLKNWLSLSSEIDYYAENSLRLNLFFKNNKVEANQSYPVLWKLSNRNEDLCQKLSQVPALQNDFKKWALENPKQFLERAGYNGLKELNNYGFDTQAPSKTLSDEKPLSAINFLLQTQRLDLLKQSPDSLDFLLSNYGKEILKYTQNHRLNNLEPIITTIIMMVETTKNNLGADEKLSEKIKQTPEFTNFVKIKNFCDTNDFKNILDIKKIKPYLSKDMEKIYQQVLDLTNPHPIKSLKM